MIDKERLKLILMGDVHESVHSSFDFDKIIEKAYEKDGLIIVKSTHFMFTYDAITYEQISGIGGG